MRRKLKGIYNEIKYDNFPDYTVIELRSFDEVYQYCVIYKNNDARTNWFAKYYRELTVDAIYTCVLLPGVEVIKVIIGE